MNLWITQDGRCDVFSPPFTLDVQMEEVTLNSGATQQHARLVVRTEFNTDGYEVARFIPVPTFITDVITNETVEM